MASLGGHPTPGGDLESSRRAIERRRRERSPDDEMPRQIIIIRHGEKDSPPDTALSARGSTRAAALAIALPVTWGKPGFIFAAADSPASRRPRLTVTPLGVAVGVNIVADKYKDGDYRSLATELLNDGIYDDALVVICWHHGTIPALAAALGGAGAPDKWESSVFDRAWTITNNRGVFVFGDSPQRLLFGDSEA